MANGDPAAAAGGDDYQVIGWLFSARDDASGTVERLQELVEVVTAAVADHLEQATTQVEDTVAGVQAEARSLGDFVKSGLMMPLQVGWNVFTGILGGVKDAVADALAPITGPLVSAFQTAKEAVTSFDFSIRNLTKTLVKAPFQAVAASVKGITGGLMAMGKGAVNTAVRLNEVVQKFFTIEKLAKGLKAAGGLMGALFGPFMLILGPIMKLLSPIIDMLVEGLMPAVETFTAIIKTAFNPLFELAEVMAGVLAPMVVKFMEPFVTLLEVAAVQVAAFVMSLFKGERSGGVFVSLFQSLGPVLMDIFRALGGLAEEFIPLIMDLFKRLAPIAVEIVKEIGALAARIMPELGRIVKEVGPKLVKAFTNFWKAITPILKPLGKLAAVLVEKVFGPIVLKGLSVLADWIDKKLVPFINEWMPAVVILIEKVTKKVSEFYGNFGKYMKDFYVLFIEPMLKWVKELWKTFTDFWDGLKKSAASAVEWIGKKVEEILGAVGLADVGRRARGVFQAVANAVRAPLETMKGLINEYLVDNANAILRWDPPGPWGTLAEAMWGDSWANYQIPHLAEGGVIGATPGGTTAVVGEGGRPEIVMPLTQAGVQAVIPPLLREAVSLPGLDEALDELRGIHRTLRGVLRVEMEDDGDVGGGPRQMDRGEMGILGGAAGLSGVGG